MPQAIESVEVGRNGLILTRLGFGTAPQGSSDETMSSETAKAVFQAAWDLGIRYFDTAPLYGLGKAEERVGQFLRGMTGYTVSSKVGRLLQEAALSTVTSGVGASSSATIVFDYTYDGVMRSWEASLKRLGLERIDMLLIHDPDVGGVGTGELIGGAGRALAELRDQGLVRAVGAGMNQWEMPLALASSGMFDLFLLAGRYTLLEQGALTFLNYCAQQHIGVVIGGVFNSGLLARPQPGASYNYASVPDHLLQRALNLQAVCARHDVPLPAAALQFPLAHPAVVSVLTAAQDVGQVHENVAAFQRPVPAALWVDLRAEGLLPDSVPTPLEAL